MVNSKSHRLVLAATVAAALVFLGLVGCAKDRPLIENPTSRSKNPIIAKAMRPLERDLIETVEEMRKRYRIPALQVRVEKFDQPIFDVTLGLRATGFKAPAETEDVWHLASHTKIMTAVLIGQAIERKDLNWNSRVGDILPHKIPEKIPLHISTRAITIDQLLSHQAGLKDPVKVLDGQLWASMNRNDVPVSELRLTLARGILATPVEFAPGTRSEYSNSGYIVLGHIAETVFKQSWEELARQRIFAPLRMKSCGFGPAGSDSPERPTQPWGHRSNESSGELEPVSPAARGADNPPAFGPAGTVHCSAEDWAKFLRVFFEDRDSRQWRAKLVRKETLDHLLAPAGNGMTFSSMLKLEKRRWANGPVYLMAGSNTMNYAMSAVAPSASLLITVNTNSGGKDAEEGAQEILRLLSSRVGD